MSLEGMKSNAPDSWNGWSSNS